VNPPTEDIITERTIKYDGDIPLKVTVNLRTGTDAAMPTAAVFKGKPLLAFGYNS